MAVRLSNKVTAKRRPRPDTPLWMVYEGAGADGRARLSEDRERHLRSRSCVVDGCREVVPCPHHGEPGEDRGEWLWARRDGAG